jgi:hypothetical protein
LACFDVKPEEWGLALSQSKGCLTPEQLEALLKIFRSLIGWLWQNGMKNPEGINIRATIPCWVFLSHLRPLTLSDLARASGKQKQSIGKWVDEFKRAFPGIRNSHMKD